MSVCPDNKNWAFPVLVWYLSGAKPTKLVGGNTALWVAGDSDDGEMVSSFQHMQLVCTIRAGPTWELWGFGRRHSRVRCVETVCLQGSSGWDRAKGQPEGKNSTQRGVMKHTRKLTNHFCVVFLDNRCYFQDCLVSLFISKCVCVQRWGQIHLKRKKAV